MNKELATTHNLLIPEVIDSWLEFERLQGNSPNTLKAYQNGVDSYLAYLNDNPQVVTAKTILEFKESLSKSYSPQTVNQRLSSVRSLYRFLVIQGYMEYSPAQVVKGVKRSKTRNAKRKWKKLSKQQVIDLLATCDNSPIGIRDKAILNLMIFGGWRVTEIHRANTDSLDTELDSSGKSRMIAYVQGKGEIEESKYTVIPKHFEQELTAWLHVRNGVKAPALFINLSYHNQNKRLTTRSISRMVRGRMEQAGIILNPEDNRYTAHSLRTTFINWGLESTGDLEETRKGARHSSADTTIGYLEDSLRLENPIEDSIADYFLE